MRTCCIERGGVKGGFSYLCCRRFKINDSSSGTTRLRLILSTDKKIDAQCNDGARQRASDISLFKRRRDVRQQFSCKKRGLSYKKGESIEVTCAARALQFFAPPKWALRYALGLT
eukprot:scaffold34921_cov162-Amphora_coffeaeformis.AAC.17